MVLKIIIFSIVFNLFLFAVKPVPAAAAAGLKKSAAPPVPQFKYRHAKPNYNGYVTLNFRNVSIPTLIRFISKITHKNFIYSGKLSGHVTIISSEKITIEEAYKAFLTAISYKGLTVVKRNGIYKIIQTVNARQNAIGVSIKKLSATGHEYETQIVFLKYLNAQSISQILVPLLSPSANIQSYAPTNSLIITDYASNLKKADKIIKSLDIPDYGQNIMIYPVRYVNVTKIAKILDIVYTGSYPPNYTNAVLTSQFVKIIPYKQANSLIIMATPENIHKIIKLVKSLDIKSNIQTLSIYVYKLKYAKAKNIASILTSVVSKSKELSKSSAASFTAPPPFNRMPFHPPFQKPPVVPAPAPAAAGGVSLVGQAVIIPDKEDNSLIIEATPYQYKEIIAVIKQLDKRRRQIFVQVVIAEVDLNNTSEIGTQYYGQRGNFFGLGNYNMSQGLADFLSNPFNVSGFVGGVAGGAISLPIGPNGAMETVPSFAALFRLIASNSAINVLSAPDLLTLDNQKAKIMVGENVPFITSTATSQYALQNIVTQVQRQNVGVKLNITPTINSDNYISLKIDAEITAIVPSPDGLNPALVGPTTSKRYIKTSVLVRNNQTIITGGLIQNAINNTTTGIPILEDIPLLGYLFKDRSTSLQRDNLVILISPKIIQTSAQMSSITNSNNKKFLKFMHKNNQKLPNLKNYVIFSPSFVKKAKNKNVKNKSNKSK